MKPIRLQPEAGDEIDAAAAWYETQRPGLGQAFRDEVRRVTQLLAWNPLLGAPYSRTGFRFHLLRRFSYIVYYADRPHFVWIVAVAHGRQRPNYWRRRRLDP